MAITIKGAIKPLGRMKIYRKDLPSWIDDLPRITTLTADTPTTGELDMANSVSNWLAYNGTGTITTSADTPTTGELDMANSVSNWLAYKGTGTITTSADTPTTSELEMANSVSAWLAYNGT